MINEYLLIGALAVLTFIVWRLWSALDRLADAHDHNADVLYTLVEAISEAADEG